MKTPAAFVIEAFKGVRPTARTLKLSPGAVSRWQKSGQIPQGHHREILRIAKRKGLAITAETLIFGGQ